MDPWEGGRMDMEAVFLPYLRRAEEWALAASRALETGAWRPDGVERGIAGELARACWRPAASRAAHEDESLDTRLSRLVGWASAIRLGMRAGGWELVLSEMVPGKTMLVLRDVQAPAPPADEDIRLHGLLTALYRPVEFAEEWQMAHDQLGLQDMSAEAAAARMAELEPGLPNVLPVIEGLLASVTELLTAAARSW